MNVVEKVRSIYNDLKAQKGSSADNWALAGRLLGRLTNDQATITRVVSERDIPGLDALLLKIEGKAAAVQSAPQPSFSESDLEHAFRAFHKRLKVSRLADESKLGGRYTSGGRKSKIDAIQPPNEFPPEIWQALVRTGKLKDMGGGFYSDPSVAE
jgi:hypothetical protein